MKRLKETRLVLREMTEKDIRGLGMSRWMRRQWWQLGLWFIVWLIVLLVIVNQINNQWVESGVAIVGYFVILLPPFVKMDRAGKRFWDEVKDKDQPIKL